MGNNLTTIIQSHALNLKKFVAIFLIYFLQSVTITVTNSDTANDTINMLLTMLGITVSCLQTIFSLPTNFDF